MSNAKQETIADIVAEMREFADTDSQSIGRDVLRRRIQDFVARIIEATMKREREATREKSSQVGNAAKIREALSGLLEIVCIDCKSPYEIDGKCVKCPRVVAAEAALSAPPRNCDVGTVAEQNERFDKYCYDHRSHEICCGKCPIFGEPCCELAWSQMPYEGGDAK